MTANKLLALSEADFQTQVIELAMMLGWLVYHAKPAKLGSQWLTAYDGHAGFPDLVLAHETGGVLFVELKTQTGRVTDAQWRWLRSIGDAGSEWHVWRPSHWRQIEERLKGLKAK